MLKAFKYRIYPNKTQRAQMDQHFNACRLVWNLALTVKIRSWEANKTNVSRYALQKQLFDLKQEYKWLYETNSQSLVSVLLILDNAYKDFFKGKGFPAYKTKNDRQSFQCPQMVSLKGDTIRIPKIGHVRIELSRQFDGKIKTVTISKTPTGKYYAAILVETAQEVVNKAAVAPETTIGIDLGIKDFSILSTGLKIENPKHLRNNLKRLKCLQRRASKKKQGSANRKKANKKLAIQHERICNLRKDFLHKVSTKLISDNQAHTFCIENLNVAGMVKNHNLAQSIADAGWSEFVRQLKYKGDWYGKNIIEIGRFEPSSKMCNHCGTVNQTLTLTDREWACASCLTVHDRDVNAAINIKNFGLKQHSGMGSPGEPVELRRLRRAKKQEDCEIQKDSTQ